jgi:predicted GNAT family acetyltransferase
VTVTRYQSAREFLAAAEPLLMLAEAENNLILAVAQGLARKPGTTFDPYLAAISDGGRVIACAVHIAPFRLVLTRGNREPVARLAHDAFGVIPNLSGVSGPSRSAEDFALAWSSLSGREPQLSMRLRIHETRRVDNAGDPPPPGRLRPAATGDEDPLAEWTQSFVTEARIPEAVDARRVVADSIGRGRLYLWEDGEPVSMAAWTGKTPNGVRLNFIYTPRELRGKGYGTACVSALTRMQLEQGNSFCWLYTDMSEGNSARLFKRIGYRPVSDVSEYTFRT